jgi:hypothetical protein
MLTKINNHQDIIAFARQLVREGVNFHPDEDFKNYINLKSSKPTYTNDEAELRNALMSQCFIVSEENKIDIYDTMSEVTLKETGLDKFIPLPSAEYTG